VCVYILGGVCMCVGVWMASRLELLEYEKIMLIKVAYEGCKHMFSWVSGCGVLNGCLGFVGLRVCGWRCV